MANKSSNQWLINDSFFLKIGGSIVTVTWTCVTSVMQSVVSLVTLNASFALPTMWLMCYSIFTYVFSKDDITHQDRDDIHLKLTKNPKWQMHIFRAHSKAKSSVDIKFVAE
uniref:Uncharacterized protein n=1 Tax=Glossina pallidipes TaxID=7398 RepID=A0A1B0A302_GLOPL